SGQAQTQPDPVALKAQLNDSLEKISWLKDQLADQGLRQRKIPTDEKEGEKEKNGAESALPVPQGEQGVPLNVVAVLCFVSFLLAYLFF
ncbi:phosphatidylinositol-binding protein scs2, partial [Ascosphaera atra]